MPCSQTTCFGRDMYGVLERLYLRVIFILLVRYFIIWGRKRRVSNKIIIQFVALEMNFEKGWKSDRQPSVGLCSEVNISTFATSQMP